MASKYFDELLKSEVAEIVRKAKEKYFEKGGKVTILKSTTKKQR